MNILFFQNGLIWRGVLNYYSMLPIDNSHKIVLTYIIRLWQKLVLFFLSISVRGLLLNFLVLGAD